MSDGMSEYWKNKRISEEQRLLEIKFYEFFEVLEDKNKRGKTIYRLKFKLTQELVPNGMTNHLFDIKFLGIMWLKNNERKANDMIFENIVIKTSQ